jgi:hypothetical protein
VAVLIAAGPAHAETTLDPSSGHRFAYERWIERARVPTPPVEVLVEDWGDPCAWSDGEGASGRSMGCSTTHPRPWVGMWRNQRWKDARDVFLHELGHVFDYTTLTDSDRDKLASIMRKKKRPWRGHPQTVDLSEQFAIGYAQCAWGSWKWQRRGESWGQTLAVGSKGGMKKFCDLVRYMGNH